MSLLVNLRHLSAHPVRLEGELPVKELDIDTRDEMIRLSGPLGYELTVEKFQGGLLVQGELRLDLECQCVRCLKPFRHRMALEPWTCHLPLEGEDAAPVVNDCVDLTPLVREDILLEFPQHPLCDPECGGLSKAYLGRTNNGGSTGRLDAGSPAWNELNKLKF